VIEQFKARVKRRQTPFDDWLYRTLASLRTLSSPSIGPLHRALFAERRTRRAVWDRLTKGLYYEPLFKSQCRSVGRRFRIENGGGDGIPALTGNLEIRVGDDVRMMDKITIAGVSLGGPGRLTIGDGAYIGPNMLISVAREVVIGKSSLIGAHMITDNPGHSMADLQRRLKGGQFTAAEARPVTIGDYVWLATGTHVFPGCRIGDGVVALPGSYIAGMDAPPFTLLGGNPARIEAKLPLPKSLIDLVGAERYEQYRAIHRDLKLK
jgi:acetyltransferase-like isoleucine patch superfamily enzyme